MRHALLALLFAASAVPCAFADFNRAVEAYQNHQFETAYSEFRRLAELGDTPSQRNLAAMYARGEHVEKDLIEAWAWAKLASEQGDEESLGLFKALDKSLKTSERRAQATARAEALLATFGKQVLAERLFPVPRDRSADCSVDVTTSAQPVETIAPKYPMAAANAGLEGHACFSFYLSPEGHPIRVRATTFDALKKDGQKPHRNKEVFVKPALEAIQKWRFVPAATEALRSVPASYCMDFKLKEMTRSEYTETKEKLETYQAEAEAGDPEAQYKLSLHVSSLASALPKQKRDEAKSLAHSLLLQSAINGHVKGQFRIATDLLTGNQCEKDPGKGVTWLMFAAQQGHREAQYLLASRLMYGDGVEQNVEKAVTWLKAAAESGHSRAKIEYAYHLLRHEPARQQEAAALLPEQPNENDLMQLEAAALGKALTGDFGAAVAFQQQALSIASEVGFDTERRAATLAVFQAQQVPTLVPSQS